MPYGYHGRILHVDLAAQTTRVESPTEQFYRVYIGGGLLGTALLMEHTTAGCEPLSGENLLVFASSVIAGTPAPGMARFTTVAKSPLTGGIGETRTEGPFGPALKATGYDAIVLHGAAKSPTVVAIDGGTVRFEDATELWGSTVGAATDRLVEAHGEDCHVAVIGPAGENSVRFASVVTGRGYQASRMGMGAVMGAKRVKALVLRGGQGVPAHAHPETVEEIRSEFSEGISKNDLTAWQYEKPGFSCWIYLHGVDAALSVHNYQHPELEGYEAYAEEKFLKHHIDELGCPDCPLRCIKAIHPADPSLDERSDGIHQEVTGSMGVNLGITNLDAVLQANHWCNQYGLDPTSLGYTISCALEIAERHAASDLPLGDLPGFGDEAGIIRLIHDIALRRGVGDALAEGSRRFTDKLGPEARPYAMEVKGLEMVPFEPRSQTNLALGYAVAPIGPRYDICEHDWDFDTEVGWDHTLTYSRTLGILSRMPMGYIGPEKVRHFKSLFTLWSAADAFDMCIFAIAPTRLLSLQSMARLVSAITGWETSSYEIMQAGMRRAHLMRVYNAREGITADADTLPDRFFEEPIRGSKRDGDVLDREAFHGAIRTFYEMMGWDADGVPTDATLIDALLPVSRH